MCQCVCVYVRVHLSTCVEAVTRQNAYMWVYVCARMSEVSARSRDESAAKKSEETVRRQRNKRTSVAQDSIIASCFIQHLHGPSAVSRLKLKSSCHANLSLQYCFFVIFLLPSPTNIETTENKNRIKDGKDN